ncbi:MAG: FAD-binding oxidoreductase [Starkeya sp.]|nr:FAD-binding oxidoreductase [Starkeya sp.]
MQMIFIAGGFRGAVRLLRRNEDVPPSTFPRKHRAFHNPVPPYMRGHAACILPPLVEFGPPVAVVLAMPPRPPARLFAHTPAFLGDICWTHGWNGQLAITADSYPNLTAPAPGLMACIGYNGPGIAMATAIGGELARWATGTEPDTLDMPVRPARAFPFHSLWPIGASIRIAYGRARNALGI